MHIQEERLFRHSSATMTLNVIGSETTAAVTPPLITPPPTTTTESPTGTYNKDKH